MIMLFDATEIVLKKEPSEVAFIEATSMSDSDLNIEGLLHSLNCDENISRNAIFLMMRLIEIYIYPEELALRFFHSSFENGELETGIIPSDNMHYCNESSMEDYYQDAQSWVALNIPQAVIYSCTAQLPEELGGGSSINVYGCCSDGYKFILISDIVKCTPIWPPRIIKPEDCDVAQGFFDEGKGVYEKLYKRQEQ